MTFRQLGAALLGALMLLACSESATISSAEVAKLQDLADSACLCNRKKNAIEVPRAMAGECSLAFRRAVKEVGFEEAPVAPDGPLTSYDMYVGPNAPGYDALTATNRPMPPMIRIDRPFNACTEREEDAGWAKLEACQKRKGYGPEEDGRCWEEFL